MTLVFAVILMVVTLALVYFRVPWTKLRFKMSLWRLLADESGAINGAYSVRSLFPGFGTPLENDSVFVRSGVAMSGTVQQTFTLPTTGVLAPTTSRGRMRLKVYNGGGTSPTLTDLVVQGSDGTNTLTLFAFHPTVAITLSTTSWFDRFFDYLVDVASSGAGGGASGQLSATIGGITSFNILTTLGGTSPTASLDVELAPLL